MITITPLVKTIRRPLMTPVLMASFLLSITGCAEAQPKKAMQPIPQTSELLLRFAPETAGRTATIEAGRSTPIDLSIVQVEIDALSKEIGVPMVVKQVNSGYWLLLDVDSQAVCEGLAEQVGRMSGVKSVSIHRGTPVGRKSGIPILSVEGGDSKSLESIGWPGYEARFEVREVDGSHEVVVDPARLVPGLLVRLKDLEEVEFVQVNASVGG